MRKGPTEQTVMEKMRTTMDLFEASVQIMKQNLLRRYPDETDEQRQERFRLWLHKGTTFEPPRDEGQGEAS